MAIVPNWAEPLKDSVLELLSRSDLTYREYESIRETAALLEGTPVFEELEQRMAQQLEKFEQRYQSALEKLGSDSISIVENGIRELFPLEGYKDRTQKIEEARAHIDRLKQAEAERERRRKKRNIWIGLAAALMAALCVVVLILNTRAEQRRIRTAIADAQAMVDAGQYEDAVTALIALTEADSTGSQYPELYPVADAVLERVSSEDDEELLAKEWELLLKLDERHHSVPSEAEIAAAYLLSLPGEDVGEAAILAVENEYLESDNPTVIQAMEHAMDALSPSGAWGLAQRASGLIFAGDSAFMSRAFETYVDSLDSANAWTVVYDALTDHQLFVSDELLSRAFEAHVQNLSLEDVLLELQGYGDDGMLDDLPTEIVAQIEGRRLHAAAEELNPNATQAQVEEWAKTQLAWLVETPSDPDAALQLVYDMSDAGYDVSEPVQLFL